MMDVYNQLKIVIEDTLKAIDLSYNNNKLTLEDYDEMISAIENINSKEKEVEMELLVKN